MSVVDLVALAWFILAWAGFSWVVDRSKRGGEGLTGEMNHYRLEWMRTMTTRDLRIIDTSIMAGLQQGTAFFASTALIAIGGGLTLLGATEYVVALFADMPFGLTTTRLQWEVKVLLLTVIFVYAFFKFAWAYRLFNYASILIGATPMTGRGEPGEAERTAERAGRMSIIAGRHFNRGVRALFFALAVLGWFISPWLFIVATTWVLAVIWHRQFASDSLRAVRSEKDAIPR